MLLGDRSIPDNLDMYQDNRTGDRFSRITIEKVNTARKKYTITRNPVEILRGPDNLLSTHRDSHIRHLCRLADCKTLNKALNLIAKTYDRPELARIVNYSKLSDYNLVFLFRT